MMAAPASETAATSPAPQKPRRSKLGLFFRILFIGILVALIGLAYLIAFPPQSILISEISKAVTKATGRDVSIGSASLKLGSIAELNLGSVTLANPPGMTGPDLFKAKGVKARVKLKPLLEGKTEIESVELTSPEINLHEDPAGRKNWVIETADGASGTALVLPKAADLTKARLAYESERTGAKLSADDVNAKLTADPATGAATAKGSLTLKSEAVSFDIAVADARTITEGKPTAVKAKVDGRHVTAEIDGSTTIADPLEISGNVSASSPSAVALAKWLGANVTPNGKDLKTTLKGKIQATAKEINFEETDIVVNGTPSRLDGTLALGGARPKLQGTIAAPKIDLAGLLGVTPERPSARAMAAPEAESAEPAVEAPWEALSKALDDLDGASRTLGAAPAPESAAAAPASALKQVKGAWSQEPIDLTKLRGIDLDVTVSADEIGYKALDLKKGRVKAALIDGRLAARLETLDIGKGRATGALELDSRANPPKAGLALNLTDVAAEPIIQELAGKPLLSGNSNVEIRATTAGQNQDQMASGLEGKAKFRMANGAMRGFDVRRMISEWWKSWSFNLANKTNFQRLDAQYDIKKGIMKSSPGLDIEGNEVAINSKGEINVSSRRLNQEIRVKVVPPPTALPIPVRIAGDWAKPSVSIDWNGLFSSAVGELGGPQAVAPSPEPMPEDVRSKIERVLADGTASGRLSEGGKEVLRSLLAQGQ